ncbi:unnamed protein product [Pedinophyceae sp. YPF-701]|nr:unnamed protein product [Pedinophyceae sp. YPF-701]
MAPAGRAASRSRCSAAVRRAPRRLAGVLLALVLLLFVAVPSCSSATAEDEAREEALRALSEGLDGKSLEELQAMLIETIENSDPEVLSKLAQQGARVPEGEVGDARADPEVLQEMVRRAERRSAGDLDAIREAISVLIAPEVSEDMLSAALELLEYKLADVDHANDFFRVNDGEALATLVDLMSPARPAHLQAQAAAVVATGCSNNRPFADAAAGAADGVGVAPFAAGPLAALATGRHGPEPAHSGLRALAACMRASPSFATEVFGRDALRQPLVDLAAGVAVSGEAPPTTAESMRAATLLSDLAVEGDMRARNALKGPAQLQFALRALSEVAGDDAGWDRQEKAVRLLASCLRYGGAGALGEDDVDAARRVVGQLRRRVAAEESRGGVDDFLRDVETVCDDVQQMLAHPEGSGGGGAVLASGAGAADL